MLAFCVDGPNGEREMHRLLLAGEDILNAIGPRDLADDGRPFKMLVGADGLQIEITEDP